MRGSRKRRALLAAVATSAVLLAAEGSASAQLIAPCKPGRCGDRVTLGVSKRVVRVGQSVYFQGAVLNEETPVIGALLTLQVRRAGRWQTFKALTTNHNGVFVGRYRFRTRGARGQRFSFRAHVPAQQGLVTVDSGTSHVRVR